MRYAVFAERYGWTEQQYEAQRPAMLDALLIVWAEKRHAQETSGR